MLSEFTNPSEKVRVWYVDFCKMVVMLTCKCLAGAVPDVYTFGGLVKSFVNSNRIDDAFVLFEKMKSAGLVPPEVCSSSRLYSS